MAIISATIRPREGLNNIQELAITKWLLHKTITKYHYGIEKADKERHMHIILVTSKIPKNISRSLKTLLGIKPKTTEWSHSVSVKEHNDEKYLLAYVCKDGNHMGMYSEEELQEAKKYYDSRRQSHVGGILIHSNNFINEMNHYCDQEGIDKTKCDFDEVMTLMFLSGEYKLNTWLMKNCRVKPRDLFHTFNRTAIGHGSYIRTDD